MSDWKYLYAIEHPDGFHKIGEGSDPLKRLGSIQVGCPYRLDMWLLAHYLSPVSSIEDGLEDVVHARMEPYQFRGEWYDADPPVILREFNRAVNADQSATLLTTTEYREQEKQKRELKRRGLHV